MSDGFDYYGKRHPEKPRVCHFCGVRMFSDSCALCYCCHVEGRQTLFLLSNVSKSAAKFGQRASWDLKANRISNTLEGCSFEGLCLASHSVSPINKRMKCEPGFCQSVVRYSNINIVVSTSCPFTSTFNAPGVPSVSRLRSLSNAVLQGGVWATSTLGLCV
jgi:hypothetical protein